MSDSTPTATPTTPTPPAPPRLPKRRALALLASYPVAVARAAASPQVRPLVGLVLFLLATGTVFFHRVEGWSWLDSLYFCVVTLATVGYGDYSPATDIGKIVTMIYILIGIGLLVATVTAITNLSFARMQTHREKLRKELAEREPDRPAEG